MRPATLGRPSLCRHCRQPIDLVACDRKPAWLHLGEHGAFYCRHEPTGMTLPTPAEPVDDPPAIHGGEHHAIGRWPVPTRPTRQLALRPPQPPQSSGDHRTGDRSIGEVLTGDCAAIDRPVSNRSTSDRAPQWPAAHTAARHRYQSPAERLALSAPSPVAPAARHRQPAPPARSVRRRDRHRPFSGPSVRPRRRLPRPLRRLFGCRATRAATLRRLTVALPEPPSITTASTRGRRYGLRPTPYAARAA